jgi:hypothetical protein
LVKTRKRGQGGAPGRGRKVGGEREDTGSPIRRPELGKVAVLWGFRRAIAVDWQWFLGKNQREMREERAGVL